MSKWGAKDREWRIQAIKRRDGFRCWLCGGKLNRKDDPVTIDHAIPKARGGSNALHNLRLAHQSCNHERGCIVETRPRAVRERLSAIVLRTEAA